MDRSPLRSPGPDRRTFARMLGTAGALTLLPSAACASPSGGPRGPRGGRWAAGRGSSSGDGGSGRPPPLDPDRVRAFVVAAHGDLERTRTMLAERPTLLNATWDWGGGDFETALGGAAHTGSRSIALLLLDGGARLDLFCAAMLGMLDVVRAVVEARPDAVGWPGPHGIGLLRHAEAGEAREVVAYLEAAGAP